MSVEERFTELPTVATATLSDIICAVQGYVSPSNLGLSVQENLGQIFNLFQSNIILSNPGNPNGVIAGTTYQFCWDSTNSILYICVISGTSSTAVWIRADINDGFTTTVTAAGTTTLTILSTYWQEFTGSTTQTVVMPVTSTLAAGMTWSIINTSTGNVTIQSSGLNTIATISTGEVAVVTCILNSGTSASSWNASINASSGGTTSVTGTANEVLVNGTTGAPQTGAVVLTTAQPIGTTSSPTFNALTLTTPLGVGSGGLGINTVPTNGQVPIGNGTDYTAATLTAGTNISISNGSGSVTISATGLAGIGWVNVTGATQAMVADTGYVANNVGTVTFTLPTTAAFGTFIYVQGIGSGASGGWTIAQNAGQNIQVGSHSTTVGATGTLSSTNQFDSITLLCVTANTTWTALGGPQSAGLTIV